VVRELARGHYATGVRIRAGHRHAGVIERLSFVVCSRWPRVRELDARLGDGDIAQGGRE
jgi:hypothetical protein